MLFLITWASRGLWEELKHQLEEKWHEVIWTYKQTLVEWLYQLDLTSEQSVSDFVQKIQEGYGQIDYLVNNGAVMMRGKKPEEYSWSEIEEQVQTNIVWTLFLTSQLLPIIQKGVVNICSKVVKRPIKWSLPYIMTKHAMQWMHETLKFEYPEMDHHIFYPGRMMTDMGWGEGEDVSVVARGIVDWFLTWEQ